MKKIESKKSNIVINWFKKNTQNLIFLIMGLAIGFSCIFFFIPERIAKLESGEEPVVSIDDKVITANDYYEVLKDSIKVDLILQDVDRFILDNTYETTSKIKKDVTENMNSLIKEYTDYYKCSEKQFFENNNLKDRPTFYDYLLIDYKRNLYYKDYIKDNISNSDLILYYNNIKSDTEIKYIMTENEDTIKSVLKSLNNGKSYNDIIKSFKSNITYQNLGYVSFDNVEIDDDIYNKAVSLKEDSYAKEYIIVDNNYAIVFKGKSKDKESINDIKDRLLEKMVNEQISKDTEKKVYYKSLIYLREQHNIKFSDTILEKEYKVYTSSYK